MNESDRPLFRNKGIKHRKPEFKLKAGEISNKHFLNLIMAQLQEWSEKNFENKNA